MCNDRLRGIVSLCWLLLGAALQAPRAAAAATGEAPAGIAAVDSIAMTVSDADRSVSFYRDLLGFELASEHEVAGEDYEHLFGVFGMRARVIELRLGDEHLQLLQFLTPRGRRIASDTRANDRSFQHVAIVVSDMQAAYARLRQHHVEYASSAPQRLPDWNADAAGIEAFYFRDPDGHFLELIAFPPGKGAAKWHVHDGRLFLGIDHTAIVVTDTASSLAFYRDQLRLRVAGTSENYGTEQEHLNGVFGAHLRITALRAMSGPGIEFLEYLSPRTEGGARGDSQPPDLSYWQINLHSAEAPALYRQLQAGHVSSQSSGEIEIHDAALGYHRGAIVRDPDGHASLIGQ